MLKKIRTREFWFQVLKQLICITMVIIVVLPILLTLFASLKNKGDMVTTSPLALPSFDRITLENYAKVFQNKIPAHRFQEHAHYSGRQHFL